MLGIPVKVNKLFYKLYMNLKRFIMSEEKKSHIPGIYNYCDRWCERCKFTSQCLLFTNESKITTHQLLNNGELPNLNDIFDVEDEKGNDDDLSFEDFDDDDDDFEFGDNEEDDDPFLNDLPEYDDKQYEEEKKQRDEAVKQNILVRLSDEYFNKAHSLLGIVEEKYKLHSIVKDNEENKLILTLYENYQVVEWFHMFIFVKIRRALSGKWRYDKEADEEMKEFETYDMNGTAKIALIAVEDSIKALNKLFDSAYEFKNEISALLVIAGKLLNEMEKEFPDCRKFVRPGLDE